MTDILRRSLAPISDTAWREIDAEARRALSTYLSARAIVDVTEPLGWEASAVNLGRLNIESHHETDDGVTWGRRAVQPLVEVRVPFVLNQMEIDNITRGANDADLEALGTAARKVAAFEEEAVYGGFERGGIRGICSFSPYDPLPVCSDSQQITLAAADCVRRLHESGIGGPYALVLPAEPYHRLLQSTRTGFPLQQVIEDLLGGQIYWSPGLESSGVLISTRGGDYQLTLGQDLGIGYASHTRDTVELYFVESFSFSVFEQGAAVVFPVSTEGAGLGAKRAAADRKQSAATLS
jgi:uncharacterized linocin/CFP29 family protein